MGRGDVMLTRRYGATCAACGRPLIPAYPGQTLHPDPCDPDPPGLTDAQRAELIAAIEARERAERAT